MVLVVMKSDCPALLLNEKELCYTKDDAEYIRNLVNSYRLFEINKTVHPCVSLDRTKPNSTKPNSTKPSQTMTETEMIPDVFPCGLRKRNI